MGRTVGWYKDAIASAVFLVCAAYFALVRAYPWYVPLAGVAGAFSVDIWFTLFPAWHCLPLGRNGATLVLAWQLVCVAAIGSFAVCSALWAPVPNM